MADMGRLIAEADAYGDTRYAEGQESRQAEVDDATEEVARYAAAAQTAYDHARAAEKALADHMQAHVVTLPPPDPEPEPKPAMAGPIIGMNVYPENWAANLATLGPEAAHLGARRIFCDLTATGRDQETLIRRAIADGMVPVLSYKVPNVATMASGGYDAWLTALRNFLASLGVPVAATYWHEPRGNMTTAQFIAGSKRFLAVRSDRVKVGPILNGWLLNAKVTEFTSWTDAELRARWDWVGADCYEDGRIVPANLITKLATWRDTNAPGKPIIVGEYNGNSAPVIAAAGEAALSTPNLWIANVWNNTGGAGVTLTGDRLARFRETLADPRNQG